MGVVNVTPDSFSDGGVSYDPQAAIGSARRLSAEGAAIVDVGGESTRPGSAGVRSTRSSGGSSLSSRRWRELPVSIDTAKAGVAERALELGAELVNDVTAPAPTRASPRSWLSAARTSA